MNGPHILVVDDEVHTREICVDFLDGTGFQVDSCSNGKEALVLLSSKPYQILLSDIQMPEMDGIALLKETKRLYPEVEIILMTAFGGLSTAVDAVRFGAYDYLLKPISRDFFLNTIRRCQEKIDLQRKLKESQSKLVEQERLAAIGTVAAWLSHKMRNSLSVILMCAHYLDQKTPQDASSDFKDVISAIIEKIRSLEKTTSDLIGYSKAYELQMVKCDIHQLLETTLSSLLLQIRDVRIQKSFLPHLPMVLCDPYILQEVFENIILNALQAIGDSKEQSILLSTTINNREDGNSSSRTVSIIIQNTGSQLVPGSEDKIFTPFFTTKESGSGLGLAIAKKVIDEHGGAISAASGVEEGRPFTRFAITLPAGQEEVQ